MLTENRNTLYLTDNRAMRFDIDVLILYADNDNLSDKNELGWVSQFKKFLGLMLNQVLGEKANIMLKSEHDHMTAPNMDNVGILISVLSKKFVHKSLKDYIEALTDKYGLVREEFINNEH